DLRGLPGPLPSHHDDDDGRDARIAADGRWIRRRQRGSPAARSDRGRRIILFAVDDALLDAGRLHLSVAIYRILDKMETAALRRNGARGGSAVKESNQSSTWATLLVAIKLFLGSSYHQLSLRKIRESVSSAHATC